MHPEIEQLDLPTLVDNLEDLEQRRTPVGWTPDDAVLKAAVERRIMELVASPPTDGERRDLLRIPCVISVKLRCKDWSVRANTRDLGIGGVFVETRRQLPIGTTVDIEIRGGSDEHGLRVRGTVAWLIDGDSEHSGVGVSFNTQYNDRNERRLRRFVLELLRHRATTH